MAAPLRCLPSFIDQKPRNPQNRLFLQGVTFTFKTTNTKYVHRRIAVEAPSFDETKKR